MQKLDYNWVETGHILTEYFVRALSWNLEGTRLLLGGRLLQLWHCKAECVQELAEERSPKATRRTATFELGAEEDSEDEGRNKSCQLNENDPKTVPSSVEGIE